MRIMLIIYAVMVGVLLFGEVMVVILMYADPGTIQNDIKDFMRTSLEDYQGVKGSNLASLGWMFIIYEFECCGVDSYKDFQLHAPLWNRDNMGTGINLTAPITCCKDIPKDGDIACAMESTLNIYEQGCFDAIWDKALGKPLYAGVGFTFIFVFQAVLVVFSAVMSKKVQDSKKVEPIYA